MMKKVMFLILAGLFMIGMTGVANAGEIYATTCNCTPAGQPTHWWDTSAPGANPGVHPEYALGVPDGWLTGWMSGGGALILDFPCDDYGLKNVDYGDGHDLQVWYFGPGSATVLASADPTQCPDPLSWVSLGALPGSTPGIVVEQKFWFPDELDCVFWVKIDKMAGTAGKFIEAVGGEECCVPIPGAVWLLGSGLLGLIGIRRKKS